MKTSVTRKYIAQVDTFVTSTHAVYGTHSFSAGYLASTVNEMFGMLNSRDQAFILSSMTRTAHMYQEMAQEDAALAVQAQLEEDAASDALDAALAAELTLQRALG